VSRDALSLKAKPLDEATCDALFGSFQECRSTNATNCTMAQSNASHFGLLRTEDRYAGISYEGLERLCKAACSTGKAMDRSTFLSRFASAKVDSRGPNKGSTGTDRARCLILNALFLSHGDDLRDFHALSRVFAIVNAAFHETSPANTARSQNFFIFPLADDANSLSLTTPTSNNQVALGMMKNAKTLALYRFSKDRPHDQRANCKKSQ
jgi:hypothetical protein